MSRAAKKRAKKRAKTSSSSGTSSSNCDGKNSKNNNKEKSEEEEEDGNGVKTKKVHLFDDNDEDCGNDYLLDPSQSVSSGSGKIAKFKKSSEQRISRSKLHKATKGENKSALRSAKYTPHQDMEDDSEAVDALEFNTEIEPEVEESLLTLTPLQLLLLDGNGSGKMKHDDGGPGSEIDPLQIIPDVNTEHRARILLGSLLFPSGVTVDEFYEKYWGKLPLLASFDQHEDERDSDAIIRHVTRLDGFLNRKIIDDIIQKNKLRYGLDLNVTRYTDAMGNGVWRRITLDPPPKKRSKMNGGKNATSSNDDDDGGDDVECIVANPNDIWTNVDTSHCTLRLLRPHEHNDNIHAMLSLLESEFGCQVGSNAYLTPLNSQGFAPHYDDVDVLILQLEGYKRWRVYAPFSKRETLPRESSRDYTEKEVEEMGNGELMDIVLGPGDVLYLPRGWVHQAETVRAPSRLKSKMKVVADGHSLHLTVSAMQNWCWADYLDILMPDALESAAASDKSISLREGLPRNFLGYMGTMHQVDDEENDDEGSTLPEGLKQAMDAQAKLSPDDKRIVEEEIMINESRARQRILVCRKKFKEEARKRIMRVCKQALSMLDDACDQIGKRFLSERLPPALLKPERCLTKEGMSGDVNFFSQHNVSTKIWPNTLCRIVRPNIARLVVEDGKAVLYHCLDNSRVFRGTPLSPMAFEIDDGPALEQLLTTVEPHWIMVKDLIHGDIEDKMEIAQALLNEGILATMLVEAADTSVQTG